MTRGGERQGTSQIKLASLARLLKFERTAAFIDLVGVSLPNPFTSINRDIRRQRVLCFVFVHLRFLDLPRLLIRLVLSFDCGLSQGQSPVSRAMATIASSLPHVNGTGVVSGEVRREVDFLKQILQIRDDVFASKHPRIHLPPKVIEQVAPRPPQTTPPSRPSTNGFPPRPDSSLQQTTQASEFVPPAQPIQRPYSAKSASSGIDPVLLTKSDHLIRAELQLKRQQIERLLKDQFDKKGRGNDNEEREAHFNVEECLMQAHLRVPPVSGLQSTTNNSDGAESFDENSYYSSKADSWSSEDVDVNQSSHADATGSHVSPGKQLAKDAHVEPAVIDLDEETYEPADDIEIYEPEQVDLGDDADEEDYSPPPADVGPSEPSRGRARDRGFGNGAANGYDLSSFLSHFHSRFLAFTRWFEYRGLSPFMSRVSFLKHQKLSVSHRVTNVFKMSQLLSRSTKSHGFFL